MRRLAQISFVVLIALVLRGCLIEFRYGPEAVSRSESSRTPSPDGRLELVVVRVQPKLLAVLAPTSDEVYVVPRGRKTDDGELIFRGWGDTYAKRVDWIGSRSVQLEATPGSIRFLATNFRVSLGASFKSEGPVECKISRDVESEHLGRLGIPFFELFSAKGQVSEAPIRWEGGRAILLSITSTNGKELTSPVEFWTNLQGDGSVPEKGAKFTLSGVEQPVVAWPPFKHIKLGDEKLKILNTTLNLESLEIEPPNKSPQPTLDTTQRG